MTDPLKHHDNAIRFLVRAVMELRNLLDDKRQLPPELEAVDALLMEAETECNAARALLKEGE